MNATLDQFRALMVETKLLDNEAWRFVALFVVLLLAFLAQFIADGIAFPTQTLHLADDVKGPMPQLK